MKNIILASKSKRRSELLSDIGLSFKVIASDIDETSVVKGDPDEYVMILAEKKLMEVDKDVKDDSIIIIAADTIVCYDGMILGKPEDEADAFRMLAMLSGDWHEVYTGLAIKRGDKLVVDYEVTRVKFRELDDEEIESYIKTEEPLDKAGAYGIQELGSLFVEKIEGDFYNVVGLPVCKLGNLLKTNFDMNIFDMR